MSKIIVIIVSLAVCAIATAIELPMLRRLKAGQSIREEGPESHKSKSGTPTMGGIAIIIAIVACSLAFSFSKETVLCCLVTLVYGGIGFIDDYIKVVKKRNLGLTAKQKLALQVIVAIFVAIVKTWGKDSVGIFIPFIKYDLVIGKMFFPLYWIFIAFVMVAMTNAVNLTDGLDGLAVSVTALVGLCFTFLFTGASAVFAAAICGACFGFLIFNHHPAMLFMGDTGSLALGGAVAACAILADKELALPIAGIIYVAEALSVIIQVYVFKTRNGRRFFRMAPLHHHFELGGWSETKVVLVFSLVTEIACIITYFAFK